jgi:hypothetical protein
VFCGGRRDGLGDEHHDENPDEDRGRRVFTNRPPTESTVLDVIANGYRRF